MKNQLLIIAALIAFTSFGQSVSELKLTNKQSILNDRIYLNFPDSAKNSARPVDIMSHDHNIEKETRIVFDNGDERLVFFIQELFALGNENLLKNVEKSKDENFNFECSEVLSTKDLKVVQSIPTKWNENQGGILINSSIVMTKDNSLIRVDVYINPAAYKNQKENYIELSKKVVATAVPGKRFNDLRAREEKQQIFGTDKSLLINIPKNYTIQVDQKYDFQVIRLMRYENLGDSTWESISIYSGHHPSYFYPDYGFDGFSSQPEVTFLGKKKEWFYFENDEEQLYLKEQKIESDEIEKGLIIHIAISSNSKERIAELTTLVEGIKLK